MGEGFLATMNEVIEKLKVFFYGFKDYLASSLDLEDLKEIGRRYAVTNSFDSVLMMLGILLGSYSTGVSNSTTVMGLIIAGAGSIFLSGFLGTYISERAERELKVKELEKAVMITLEETIIGKMERRKAILIALMSGGVPSLVVVLLAIPFYLNILGFICLEHSYASSVIEALSFLLIIGAYLGSISGKSRIIYALLTLGAGLLLVVIAIWIGIK